MKPKAAAVAPTLSHRLAPTILACFFLSGMTALVYEIIWMRMISRVIGGAPFAVSTILVVFMGGMGLGSYLAGKKADQIEAMGLVRTYGILELTIGFYALLVPILLMILKALFGVLYNALFQHTLLYNLCIFAGALVLLALPAVCMGATLPILCRFFINRLSHVGSHAGLLYGLNTIGAAVGAMVCGFWLINGLGVWGTMLMAVACNCAVGFLCLRLGARPGTAGAKTKSSGGKKTAALPPESDPLPHAPDQAIVTSAALTIFFVSGFCAMAYEVIWTKLLGLIVGPTTYSFTIVLVTFIVGLALGNLVFGRLADRAGNAAGMLVASQIAAALLALAMSQIMGNSQLFFAKLIYTFKGQFGLLTLAKALTLFGFMVLPTFFLGATFPLVAKIYTRTVADVGRSIGRAYAVNTIGAVLGSFCAGFVLIPMIGKENGLRLVIALQMASAIIVGIFILTRRKANAAHWGGLIAALAAGAVLCIAYPSWNRHLLATGKYHRFDEHIVVDEMIVSTGWFETLLDGPRILGASEGGELIYYGDGIGGFTTVLKYPGPFGVPEYSMANSGKMDASSMGDMKTQTLLAHFPMLFAPNHQKVMVLGLASGITAGEVLHYPVAQLDVVDINDRVFEAARYFSPWNNGVLTDSRTHLILQDGMAHLGLTRTRYDVIISEPSNPWMAGMASLFTRDFFESTAARLTDDGIYVQWFHCYQMDWSSFALIGRTFAEVFPTSMLVSCEPGGLARDFLFVGFKNKGGLNWDNARKNIGYAQASTNIELAAPELLHRMIVSEDIKALFGHGPINTDDHPLLEYAAPKLMHQGDDAQQALLQHVARGAYLSPETKAAADKIRNATADQIDFARYALSVYAPFPDMVDLARTTLAQKAAFIDLLTRYCTRNPMDFSFIQAPEIVQQLQIAQITAIEKKLPAMQAKAPAYFFLAQAYSAQGMTDAAIANYRNAVRENPDDAASHNDLGYMLAERGDVKAALDHFKAALRVRPNFLLALGNIAYTCLQNNQLDEALHYFRESLRVRPGLVEALYQIAQIQFKRGEFKASVRQLDALLHQAPNLAQALNLLAVIQAAAPDPSVHAPKSAVAYAEKACALTSEQDPVMLTTLAVAYAADGKLPIAVQTADKAKAAAREMGRPDLEAMVDQQMGPYLQQAGTGVAP